MKIADIRNFVNKNYKLGQIVKLKINDNDRHGKEKISVKILGFYSEHVLLEHNGYIESFRYWDFIRMTTGIEKQKTQHRKAGFHKNSVAS